jgi:hypothetical protein
MNNRVATMSSLMTQRFAVVLVATLGIASVALAQATPWPATLPVGTYVDYAPNAQVTAVGAQDLGFYFRVAAIPLGASGNQCRNAAWYVDVAHMGNEDAVSRMQSTVMAAYLSGRPLTFVRFRREASGWCYATVAQF